MKSTPTPYKTFVIRAVAGLVATVLWAPSPAVAAAIESSLPLDPGFSAAPLPSLAGPTLPVEDARFQAAPLEAVPLPAALTAAGAIPALPSLPISRAREAAAIPAESAFRSLSAGAARGSGSETSVQDSGRAVFDGAQIRARMDSAAVPASVPLRRAAGLKASIVAGMPLAITLFPGRALAQTAHSSGYASFFPLPVMLPVMLLSMSVIAGVLYWAWRRGSRTQKGKEHASKLKPVAVEFGSSEKEMRLLSGPPQTRGYRSGFVVLAKGQSMHEHSTGLKEEALVIIEGAGIAILPEHEDIAFRAGTLIYIPPDTRHSIQNTGEGALKYIYLTAPAGGDSGK